MIWYFLTILGFLTFVREQLRKYLGIDIDWHLLFHLVTISLGILALMRSLLQKEIKIKKGERFFLLNILCFLVLGLAYLENGIFVTYWGIFEYLYIFLWGYFLSFFTPSKNHIEFIFTSFKILVFLMIGIAIYQEVEYLLYKFGVIQFMIFKNHPSYIVRLDFIRPPSLVGSPTEWGSVALIYFLIELYLKNFKLSFKNLVLIFAFIISVTRSLYLCLLGVAFFILFFKGSSLINELNNPLEKLKAKRNFGKMKFALLLVSSISAILLINILRFSMQGQIDFLQGKGHLRGYALEIWVDYTHNKIIGLGPGMFGSYVSFKTNTPLLESFYSDVLYNVERIKTIDSYWIQLAIETGMLGFIINVFLFLAFYKIMFSNFKEISRDKRTIKAISFSCMFIPLIYAINGIGFTTFIASYVIWTSLLAGMTWGYVRNS